MYTRQIGGSRRVDTPTGAADLRIHLMGPHPIVRHFLGRMNFARIVNGCLGTAEQSRLDHAQTLAVLVQNILLAPSPLYRISEWVVPIDHAALGLSEAEKQTINDDRVARTLDALASPRARNLFFRLALRVIKEFELDVQRIHHDTTSVSFSGRYRQSWLDPRLALGHSKDRRPDLRQLVFGLNVTADGAVPVSHFVVSGNRTDDTVHRNNLDELRAIVGGDDFIYVADSKLCTAKNISHIANYGGQFVTVLPRTRAEDKHFRNTLRNAMSPVRWRKLEETPDSRGGEPIVYHTTVDAPPMTNDGYRIVWFRSSKKATLDAATRETNLGRTVAELADLRTKLNKRQYKSRAVIAAKVAQILREFRCQSFLEVQIRSRTVPEKRYKSRGRPGTNARPQIIPRRVFDLEVQRNVQALRAEARTDGVFPIITNVPSPQCGKAKLLHIYKYQPYIEKRHSLLKSELVVAPVFLKKPHRASGLLHAAFLAMMVDALIERTLRRGMQLHEVEELPLLPEHRSTTSPTTARLLEAFGDLAWCEFERAGELVTFPIKLTGLHRKLLGLLDIDPRAAYG
jgi:transposase